MNSLSALSATLGVRAMSYSKRILKRMRGHPREWGPQEHSKAVANLADLVPPQLPVRPVQPLPSGWSPPLGASPTLPFRVTRTALGQQIPVYSDLKNGQTRKLTVVRRVEGDTSALALELHRVTGGAKVQVRPGRVEIAGDRSKEVKQWLAGLGF